MSKRCPICHHADVGLINEQLRQRYSIRTVAKAHNLGKTLLGEHAKRCLRLSGESHGASPVIAMSEDGERESRPARTVSADSSGQSRTVLERPPRARAAGDPNLAISPGDRARFCADIIVRGQWNGRPTVKWLCGAWGVGRDAVHGYRREGAILVKEDRGELAEQLEDTLGAYRRQEEDAEEQADKLEAGTEIEVDGKIEALPPDAKALSNARGYRQLAQKARTRSAQIVGLLQARVSISLEADPRFAGLRDVIWEALGELDSIRERYLAEVEQLTGGTLLGEELPSATDFVSNAVRKYEEQHGARSPGRLSA